MCFGYNRYTIVPAQIAHKSSPKHVIWRPWPKWTIHVVFAEWWSSKASFKGFSGSPLVVMAVFNGGLQTGVMRYAVTLTTLDKNYVLCMNLKIFIHADISPYTPYLRSSCYTKAHHQNDHSFLDMHLMSRRSKHFHLEYMHVKISLEFFIIFGYLDLYLIQMLEIRNKKIIISSTD